MQHDTERVSHGLFIAGYSSLISLYAEFFVENAADFIAHHGHVGHDHSHAHEGPSVHAAWLAAGSILVKEWLYRATMKVAKERKSTVLASNGRQSPSPQTQLSTSSEFD